MFFTRGAAKQYVDRGDVIAYDFDTDDFTKDGTWRVLSLHNEVGYRSVWIYVRLHFQVLQTGRAIKFRQQGNTNEINIIQRCCNVSSIPNDSEFWIMTNDDGEIEYSMVTASYTYLDLVVRGWYK